MVFRYSFWALSLCCVGLSVYVTACAPDESAEEERSDFLLHVSDFIQAELETVHTAATQFSSASAAWSQSFESDTGDSDALRDVAREAYANLFVAWQRLEVIAVGPAGARGTFAAGAGLRDEIYSWPVSQPCLIDLNLVDEEDIELNSLLEYGLDGLAYVLYNETEDKSCSDLDLSETRWMTALPDLDARRARYATLVAAKLETDIESLQTEWQELGSSFSVAGLSNSVFRTEQEGINQVFQAFYYFETVVKDQKIGIPVGIITGTGACGEDICPDRAELPLTGLSLRALQANLAGAQVIFSGGTGEEDYGFYHLLTELGAQTTADAMRDALANAVSVAAGLEGSVETLVATDSSDASALYNAIKSFTDLLKSEFVTVLNVEIPAEGAGDND